MYRVVISYPNWGSVYLGEFEEEPTCEMVIDKLKMHIKPSTQDITGCARAFECTKALDTVNLLEEMPKPGESVDIMTNKTCIGTISVKEEN